MLPQLLTIQSLSSVTIGSTVCDVTDSLVCPVMQVNNIPQCHLSLTWYLWCCFKHPTDSSELQVWCSVVSHGFILQLQNRGLSWLWLTCFLL